MQRSASVTVVGVFSLLGSLAILLLGCLMLLAMVVAPRSSTPMPRFATMAMSSLFLFGPGLWGIATSIGLFRLKGWARTSILIFAGLLTFMGLCAPLAFLVVPNPPGLDQAGPSWATIRAGMSVFYLCFAAIGVWWLVLFTRSSVKEQFQSGARATAASQRPLSITIISWLLLLSSPFTLAFALLQVPALFFNALLTGWAASLCYLGFAVVTFLLGLRLLRLNPRARVLAIYYSVFAWVNGALTYLLPGAQERLRAMANGLPTFLRVPSNQPVTMMRPWLLVVWTSLFMAAQIYFLVTRKPAFDRAHPGNSGPSSFTLGDQSRVESP